MNGMKYINTWLIILLLSALGVHAQGEMTVDWEAMEHDSIVPVFSYCLPLGSDYAEAYDVRIEYPELEPVPDTAPYFGALQRAAISDWPEVSAHVGIARRQGQLDISFIPVIFRDGKYQRFKSFDLKVNKSTSQQVNKSTGQRVAGELLLWLILFCQQAAG